MVGSIGGYQISNDFSIASNGIVIASSTGSKIHHLGWEMRFLDRLRQSVDPYPLVITDDKHPYVELISASIADF